MYYLLGDKNRFAAEINFTQMTPRLCGYTALWINGIQVGDFKDENILGPFMGSLSNMIRLKDRLWNPRFEGRNCEEIFYTIDPIFDDPYSFFDLPEAELDDLEQFDIFKFSWGENFDDWAINVVVKDESCTIMWYYDPTRGHGGTKASGHIQCFEVSMDEVRAVYHGLCDVIPDEYWPWMLKKYEE